MEDSSEWNPGYWRNGNIFIPYEKRYFCDKTKLIYNKQCNCCKN